MARLEEVVEVAEDEVGVARGAGAPRLRTIEIDNFIYEDGIVAAIRLGVYWIRVSAELYGNCQLRGDTRESYETPTLCPFLSWSACDRFQCLSGPVKEDALERGTCRHLIAFTSRYEATPVPQSSST